MYMCMYTYISISVCFRYWVHIGTYNLNLAQGFYLLLFVFVSHHYFMILCFFHGKQPSSNYPQHRSLYLLSFRILMVSKLIQTSFKSFAIHCAISALSSWAYSQNIVFHSCLLIFSFFCVLYIPWKHRTWRCSSVVGQLSDIHETLVWYLHCKKGKKGRITVRFLMKC